jgi:hypothetical protein
MTKELSTATPYSVPPVTVMNWGVTPLPLRAARPILGPPSAQ